MFGVDFTNKTVVLLKEAFAFKKYKAMNKFLAVITGILMLPFVCYSLIFAFLTLLASFAYKVLITPTNFIHNLINKEGKEVHPASQFIIYLISWPIIFALYLLFALLLIEIVIYYAFLSSFTYIWTLGGYKFHVMVTNVNDIKININRKYNNILPLIYVCINSLIMIVIPLIHGIIIYSELYAFYLEELFSLDYYCMYLLIGCIFSILYTSIGLAPRPKCEVDLIEKEIIEI